MEGNKTAGFFCRAPQSPGGELFFDNLESAQRFALENSRYGCAVTDGQGTPL